MASLKFGQVFGVVMLACGVSAAFVPAEVSDRLGTPLQLLFSPVSSSVHGGAGWFQSKVGGSGPRDIAAPDGEASLAEENRVLRGEVATLYTRLQALAELNADRAAMGDLRLRCVPGQIVSIERSGRQTIGVVVPEGATIAKGMPALTARGVIGRVASAFRGTVRVQLTTDTDETMRIQAGFLRYETRGDGAVVPRRLGTDAPLVMGTGAGMRIANLSMRQVEEAGVRAGDYVILSDVRDWPAEVQGRILGSVGKIEKARGNPLMAEVTVTPGDDPARLKEVMILNR